MSNPFVQSLIQKLDEYKNKYFKNQLIKGLLISFGLLAAAFLLFNTLEYFVRFNSVFRGILFFSFLGLLIFTFFYWILKPTLYLLGLSKPITNESAAIEVGKFFPEIKDKLLNTLQLASISSEKNSFLEAAIQQKTQELKFVRFADAVNINENKKYLKFILPLVLLLVGIFGFAPKLFKDSSTRIVNFQNEYAEPAPFQFKINNKELRAFKNEDFELNLSLQGSAIPNEVFVVYNDRKFKMETLDSKNYKYVFSKVQNPLDFNFEAASFKSNGFELEVANRPNLLSFDVSLDYPAYLGKADETLDNIGNLVIPEGTIVSWTFKATDTDSLMIQFDGEKKLLTEDGFGDKFSFSRKAKVSNNYHVFLKNAFSANQANIDFYMNVVPDKFPQIQLEQFRDSTLFNYIVVGGNLVDDYGITALKLFYKSNRETDKTFTAIDIPFNKSQNSQSYYYQLPLDNLKLAAGERIDYYLQVTDNDGVNGPKSTKTPIQVFAIPTAKQINQDLSKSAADTENELEKALEKSKKLKEELNQLEKRLKAKKDLDFQDKKQLEDLIKKREELMNQLKTMQEQFQALQQKQERFSPPSPELNKKNEMLQKLMEEITKTENEKMFEDLKKMMEKNLDDKTIEQIEKTKNAERNIDKELDRALKLFKQLQLQQKVEKTADELNKLAEKQEKLAEKTEKQPDPTKAPLTEEQKKAKEEIKKEQEQLKKELEEKKKDLKEIEEKSKEAKKPLDMEKPEQEQQDAKEEQKKAQDKLDEDKPSDAAKAQKKAAKSMRNMSAAMMDAMKTAEMKQSEEDIDALRDILENLIKLSFDEERLMKEFRNMSLADPRFVQFSQEQLKLQDDAKVVEDSLYALSTRVMQLKSFVTREVTDMNNNMSEAVLMIKERKLNIVSAKQQFAMTSINNLALMLSDAFKSMQQAMAAQMPGAGSGGKDGKKKGDGSLGESQKKMNEKIQKMQQGGKGQGPGQSEEIAKLAAQQAAMRRRIQEIQDGLKGSELGKKLNGDLEDLKKKMDESETDLVNKRINQELINRQKDILIRLMESEKAILQQEQDPNRTSQTAKSYERKVPPAFEKYIEAKQKQIELLLTVPPSYTPFYKKETDGYFKKLK
jgi:hypothetical protein